MPGLVLLLVHVAAADHPLHYRFSAGDQLVYERRATTTALDSNEPRSAVTERIQVWCLQRVGQEMLVLLDELRSNDERSEPAVGLPFKIDEAGRPRWPEEVPPRAGDLESAFIVIPRLPLAVETDALWYTAPDLWGQQWRCTNQGPRAEPTMPAVAPGAQSPARVCIAFTAENQLGLADTLGLELTGRFWFDPNLGCLTRIEADEVNRQRATRTHVVAVLREKLTRTPAWAARRAEEEQRYLRSFRHEDRLLHELSARGEDLPQIMEQLDRLWAAFRSDVDARAGSPFALLADARRQRLRSDAETLRARAALGRRWMNQLARPWSLQDPNGRTLTSEATRKGVVIECFWSAESLWGLRALESFRQLASRASPGVRVLCYNMDSDPALATAAIQRCGAGLTHILAGPLQDTEALPEFPVVRVVDAQGIVRDLWVGWQPDYAGAREAARTLSSGPPR